MLNPFKKYYFCKFETYSNGGSHTHHTTVNFNAWVWQSIPSIWKSVCEYVKDETPKGQTSNIIHFYRVY